MKTKLILLICILTYFISERGYCQDSFKGTFIGFSSGVKYVQIPDFNNNIEDWLILNQFLPRMGSRDALNWGVSSDVTFQFPFLKIFDISFEGNYSYFLKEYKNANNVSLRIDANQLTPSLNTYLRLGPLRLGMGGFYSFYKNKWHDNLNNTVIEHKNNHFGYSFNFILITHIVKKLSLITKAKYEIVTYKIDDVYSNFDGISFNLGLTFKL